MAAMTENIPLEIEEQMAFIEWLDLQGLKYTAIPNSTFTKSPNQKAKNRREGLRAGFPDLVVLIPPSLSKDGEGYMLCIEMKRASKSLSTVSKAQKEWQESINELETNVHAYVAYGFDQSTACVKHYLAKVLAFEF